MYRTSDLRFTKSTERIPEISSEKIGRLSIERRIDISSKIEILQTLTGYRWVGEASHDVSSTEPSAPTDEQQAAMSLLDDMGLASRFDWLERSGRYFSWVQFAINQPMLDTFMDKNHSFSVIEEGAVYGYPISSTLAFAGIIPKKTVRQKSVVEHYMFGVNSEKYYEREVEHAKRMWTHLCEIAPELTAEAHEAYEKIAKEIAISPPASSSGQGDGGVAP
jgi:hypothetical protein